LNPLKTLGPSVTLHPPRTQSTNFAADRHMGTITLSSVT
jgi:hypothetical protein